MYQVGKRGPIRRLSPAYDLVSTSFFDRFSKELAMAVGGARDIRDVKPSSFDLLANSLGITSSYLRSIVAPIADNAEVAIREAGNESLGSSQKFLPLSGRRSAGRHRPAPSRLRGVLQSLAACILAGKLFSVRPISPLPERKLAA